jgi:hypothetical protein
MSASEQFLTPFSNKKLSSNLTVMEKNGHDSSPFVESQSRKRLPDKEDQFHGSTKQRRTDESISPNAEASQGIDSSCIDSSTNNTEDEDLLLGLKKVTTPLSNRQRPPKFMTDDELFILSSLPKEKSTGRFLAKSTLSKIRTQIVSESNAKEIVTFSSNSSSGRPPESRTSEAKSQSHGVSPLFGKVSSSAPLKSGSSGIGTQIKDKPLPLTTSSASSLKKPGFTTSVGAKVKGKSSLTSITSLSSPKSPKKLSSSNIGSELKAKSSNGPQTSLRKSGSEKQLKTTNIAQLYKTL